MAKPTITKKGKGFSIDAGGSVTKKGKGFDLDVGKGPESQFTGPGTDIQVTRPGSQAFYVTGSGTDQDVGPNRLVPPPVKGEYMGPGTSFNVSRDPSAVRGFSQSDDGSSPDLDEGPNRTALDRLDDEADSADLQERQAKHDLAEYQISKSVEIARRIRQGAGPEEIKERKAELKERTTFMQGTVKISKGEKLAVLKRIKLSLRIDQMKAELEGLEKESASP